MAIINSKNRDLYNFFIKACETGQSDIVQSLIYEPMIDPTDEDSRCLLLAASSGYDIIVLILLCGNRGINPFANDGAAIRWACMFNHESIVKLLINRDGIEKVYDSILKACNRDRQPKAAEMITRLYQQKLEDDKHPKPTVCWPLSIDWEKEQNASKLPSVRGYPPPMCLGTNGPQNVKYHFSHAPGLHQIYIGTSGSQNIKNPNHD